MVSSLSGLRISITPLKKSSGEFISLSPIDLQIGGFDAEKERRSLLTTTRHKDLPMTIPSF